jgi:hypothetical protein
MPLQASPEFLLLLRLIFYSQQVWSDLQSYSQFECLVHPSGSEQGLYF